MTVAKARNYVDVRCAHPYCKQHLPVSASMVGRGRKRMSINTLAMGGDGKVMMPVVTLC
jgi:hypothetical protein